LAEAEASMKTSEVGYDYLDRAGPCPGPCLDCLKQCEPSCETFEERWRWLLEVREGRLARFVELSAPQALLDGARKLIEEAQEQLRRLLS